MRNGCSVTDIERKMWEPSKKWRKQRGCQILNEDRILIGLTRRIKRSFLFLFFFVGGGGG